MPRGLASILLLIYAALPARAAIPVTFEENRGQVAPEVAFLARTAGYRVFFTREGAVIPLQDGPTVRINLAHSHHPAPVGTHRLLATTNYLFGSDRAHWKTGIANYDGLTYSEVYPGIDQAWHAHGDQIEHDFLVAPGADPRRIRLVFSGASLRITPEGDLIAGTLRFHKPRAYQGDRQIECRYELAGHSVRFSLGPYDHARSLTIDPVLSFATFLGASGDRAVATALDAAGNVYVAGTTKSPTFPVTPNAYQPRLGSPGCPTAQPFGGITYVPCYNIFIAKFSGDGKTLLYATYLGGGGPVGTGIGAIAVSSTGKLYLLGGGSFPMLKPLPGQMLAATNTFVTALSADGSALLFATALPAPASALAVDAAGSVYITGSVTGGLPAVNAYQPLPGGQGDAFAMKLDATGSNILYSTCLGGSGNDTGYSIAVDAAGRAYIAGATASPDFPLAAPLQPNFAGSLDAFVAVLDPGGAHLVWSTYLVGSGVDRATSIAVDPAGNVHIAGGSTAAKIRGDGSALIFVSRFSPFTFAFNVAADAAGNTYIAGTTSSNNLPPVNAVQPALAGPIDAFVAEFNGQTGATQYATYLGGSQNENATSLAVDSAGNVSISGFTSSPDFPLNNPWQSSFSSVFVAKLAAQFPAFSVSALTDAASYTATVAPGELVSIFGTALAAAPASATQLPLPTQLSDTQVTVNGVAAPLVYASAGQLNAQIPFEAQTGAAQVQVASSAGTTTMTVQIAAAAPAIFTLNQQGTGAAAIQHSATYQLVTDSNPAVGGEIVSIYCTGLGPVNPPAQTGAVPPDPPPQTLIPVQVSIAGGMAPVLYAGVAPGFPGLYQVNAQIPAGTPSGAQRLQIIQNGLASNTVTVAVQ